MAGTFVAHLTFPAAAAADLALAHTGRRERERDGRQPPRRRRTLTLNNSSCENIEGGQRREGDGAEVEWTACENGERTERERASSARVQRDCVSVCLLPASLTLLWPSSVQLPSLHPNSPKFGNSEC